MSSTFTITRALSTKGIGIISTLSLLHKRSNTRCEASTLSETPIMSSNPLLEQSSLPKFSLINPKLHVKSAIEHDLSILKNGFADFENRLSEHLLLHKDDDITFESVIDKLEVIQAPLSYSWGCVGHLMGVQNSPELRSAHDEMQKSVIEANQKLGQSVQLFKALQEIKKNKWEHLDEAQQRIINASLLSMESSGVGLEGEAREKFNKLKLEGAELSTKFSNNVLDSTKAFKLLLTNREDIEGLPDSAIGLAVQQAINEGHVNATKAEGPWLLSLSMPSYLPAMQHIKKRDIREKLYRAYVTRASTGDVDNVDIIKRILQIKTEVAKLLGYKCYADLSLASKMAPSTEKVLELTNMLRDKSYPG